MNLSKTIDPSPSQRTLPISENQRMRLSIRGMLQGVGFRPFVYQLAHRLGLKGWALNNSQGVLIEVEGNPERLQKFVCLLEIEKPLHSSIQGMEISYFDPQGYEGFQIKESDPEGESSALILPDIATCRDCLQEIKDPSNRRYGYPFTNCTQCGPRFSIVESLPYDRSRTSMKDFEMCGCCREEYENPEDRRFHAQPNACPDCGPRLEFWNRGGECLADRQYALEAAIKAFNEGAVVAVKGLGGYHLMTDARSDRAVSRLRELKNREEKPFAIMSPSLEHIRTLAETSSLEERLLCSPEAPIVLLRRKAGSVESAEKISQWAAPSNPWLGIMLPSCPLHHLLMIELGYPVVATSGNLSEETICIRDEEALDRLGGIADFFLVHNRPIVRHMDDSIARVILDREQVLRRARGYAPGPITLKEPLPSALAVGGQLKNSVAFSRGSAVFVSQHLGDLENAQTFSAFEKTIASMSALQQAQPEFIACDHHPDYSSTRFANRSEAPTVSIQHHVAHVFSCLAENELEPPVLGVAWDGSGFGMDGTVWGGEFFSVNSDKVRRVSCFRPFPLPGGESAVREPRRSALGLLYELLGKDCFSRPEIVKAFSDDELQILKTMLAGNINCPMTSSCGRLFDAIASLTGIRQRNTFEGQAAMELEFSISDLESAGEYPINIVLADVHESIDASETQNSSLYEWRPLYRLDWGPMVLSLLADLEENVSLGVVALKFHKTLVSAICLVAHRQKIEQVVLTGGCFQNKTLTELAVQKLRREEFRAFWHQRVPPNDGGLALGQIAAASWQMKEESVRCV